jgi:ABC-2 type transport system permease protein
VTVGGRRRSVDAAASEQEASWLGYAALDAGWGSNFMAATSDLAEAARRWRGWSYLAVESVKNQYRRTVLGPWWMTIQTAFLVSGLAMLFGAILGQDLHSFLPYVAVGMLGFNLLAGMTRYGSDVFIHNAGVIKSTRQPLSALLLRGIAVEAIQFSHNMIIYVALVALGVISVSPQTLIAIPVLLFLLLNGLAVGMWLGPTVARFRDVGPLVTSILQVLMFFTPIFWRVDALHPSKRAALLEWNPFAYLLDALREPLLGTGLHMATFRGAAVITAVNVVLGVLVFTHARSRLPYWVA